MAPAGNRTETSTSLLLVVPSNALNFFAYVFCKSYAPGPVHMLSSMLRFFPHGNLRFPHGEVVFYTEEDLN